jgi:hypothetical protein
MGEKLRIFMMFTVILFLFSCAKSINVAEYRQSAIDSKVATHQLPQYVIDKKKPKIAVLPPSDSTMFKNTTCGLSQAVHENFTQTIAKIGTIEIVERGQLEAFMQEMKFQAGITNEIDVDKFMNIAKDVDYVFVGSISSAGVKASYTPSSTWTDKKGKVHYSSPSCSNSGNIIANFRLVTFPSGSIQQVFQMDGQKSGSRNVSGSHQCNVQDPCGLLTLAIYRAIDDARESLAEAFPLYGYIYKTMTHKSNAKNRIAYINLGKIDGIEANSEVDIIEYVKEKDPVKGSETLVPRVIAECTVVDTDLLPDRSMCIIPEDASEAVLVKHSVRTKVKTSVFRGMQKIYRKIF